MKITNIQGLKNFILKNSGFQEATVNNVITTLGYPLKGSDAFVELSSVLNDCALHGANCGFGGFVYYVDTIAFYRANRKDIISHMEQTAAEFGTDIISMVRSFGAFQNNKPTPLEVGRALWDSNKYPELTHLYNVFAWYALEEVARIWQRYLEENPAVRAKLSA